MEGRPDRMGDEISQTKLAGTIRCGVVLFFTAMESERYRMIPVYVHHNGYPMTSTLREMKWTALVELGYAAKFQN